MIRHNELVIDGVKTSSFPFKVIVHESPSVTLGDSKTNLLEHDGISGAIVMTNDPDNPSFKTATGKLIKWAGDFITVDTAKGQNVGVVLGPGIQSLKFETVWGWA